MRSKILMNRNIKTYFLDGFAFVYRPKEIYSSFKAKKNIASKKDMDFICKMPFQQTSRRMQDLEFAESIARDLSLKIKAPLLRRIKQTDKIIIGQTLYDIIYLDEDNYNKHLYIYLEEVGEIE